MKLLMIRACEESVSAWAAGEFIDYQTVLVWNKVRNEVAIGIYMYIYMNMVRASKIAIQRLLACLVSPFFFV